MPIFELVGPTGVGKTTLALTFMRSNAQGKPYMPAELTRGKNVRPRLGQIDAFLLDRLLPRLMDQHRGAGNIFDFYHRLDYFYRKLLQDSGLRHHYGVNSVLDDDPVSHLFLAELVALARNDSKFEEFTQHRVYIFVENALDQVLSNHEARATRAYRALNGFSRASLESKIVAPYLEHMGTLKAHLGKKAVRYFEIDLSLGLTHGVEALKAVIQKSAPDTDQSEYPLNCSAPHQS